MHSTFTLRNVRAYLASGFTIGETFNVAYSSPRIRPTLAARAFLAIAVRLSPSTHLIKP